MLEPIDCFILQANVVGETNSDWKGYTGTMGKALKNEFEKVADQVKD